MRRLIKRDVEELLARYDEDPIGALSAALATLCDADPALGFDELVTRAVTDTDRAEALRQRETSALDDLARDLNELRSIP